MLMNAIRYGCAILLCFALLVGTAQARLILGAVEDAELLLGREAQIRILADYLSEELDREVRIRLFEDSDRLLQWMLRFREVDLALVSHAHITHLPAGRLMPVADVQFAGRKARALDVLVSREGMSPHDVALLQRILFTMGDLPPGEAVLRQLGVAHFMPPGGDLPRMAAPRPAPVPLRAQAPPTAVVKAQSPKASTVIIPQEQAPPAAEQIAVPQPPPTEKPGAADVPGGPPIQAHAEVDEEDQALALDIESAPADLHTEEPPAARAVAAAPLVFASVAVWQRVLQVLLVIAAVAAAIWVVRRRQLPPFAPLGAKPSGEKKNSSPVRVGPAGSAQALAHPFIKASQPLSVEPPPKPSVSVTQRSKEEDREPLAARQSRLQLKGELDYDELLSLLHTVAAYPRPGTVVIRTSQEEKRIHFRQGKIAAVFSLERCEKTQKCSVANKLGSLLLRMNLINEEQRDRALEVCAQTPGLRFGEALQQSGILSSVDLRQALRSQAEGMLFSLFLFPEGRYEIIGGSLDFSVEDDLAIPVRRILDEAAARAHEWGALRDSLTSRERVFAFTEKGRSKLPAIRLTQHQKSLLELIDGRRSLRDLGRETTMLDFEFYKFMYMMVRAGVLEPVQG